MALSRPASSPRPELEIVVIGAGPAGLTAAYELGRCGVPATVLEADEVVGGISRTVEREGWRFDIGGHRFFTKVARVEAMWQEILSPEDFPLRPRRSRILYRGRYFSYPLSPLDALRKLGPLEAARCLLSYAMARVRPPLDQSHLEGWVSARFGRRLYQHFFKTYNEKVWGVPATDISSDWASQRIKDLSLAAAVRNGLRPRRPLGRQTEITSLIEEFHYPTYGPGMMWDRCCELAEAAGTKVRRDQRVTRIRHEDGRAVVVECSSDGETAAVTSYPCTHVVSSMPLPELVRAMDPPAPPDVRAAADELRFRDFLTVALVVPRHGAFPDNWIYVHSPHVRLGRIQNFGAWSASMVQPGRTCLGLEYFVFEGDELWNLPDADLVELGTRELAMLGLVDPQQVEAGYVVRMPRAYPVYTHGFDQNVAVLREWLAENAPNVHPVGRNGMHRYNNQDHSMLTAMLTVENILGLGSHDIWSVNVDGRYHEHQHPENQRADHQHGPAHRDRRQPGASGRDAPVLPRRTRPGHAG